MWIRRLQSRIGAAWCSLMHDSARWPIHGHYACGTCGRQYRVPWAEAESIGAARMRRPALPNLSSPVLPALILIALVTWPVRAAERTFADDAAAAAAVLQRFIVSQGEAGSWPVETIDIEASLPKLKKAGSLRAIRRLPPLGEPDYKVLEIGGDPTVDRQVITRYISADVRAAEFPVSSVAVVPANYKIRYIGSVLLGNRVAYAFRMVPRRKSEGLINGVLWLDSETAIVVRETGYLAKSPSVFVKRINVTRENDLDNGKVAARITHVGVEMRLLGRAQLVILERPSSDELMATATAGAGQ
ncbi:MAG TPA: hypothetical protein VKB88_34960 [Bryobacteraceae bacterium]|nr:hypothetical protein [Bryobacteraceae bacterium]